MRDGWLHRAWRTTRERVAAAFRAHLTPGAFGKAVGIGVFIGFLPLVGLHIFICMALARWMRLNQAITVIAAHVSNPLTLPFIIVAELAVGEVVLHGRSRSVEAMGGGEGVALLSMFSQGWDVVLSLVVGSVILGGAIGLVSGLGSLLVWRLRGGTAVPAGGGVNESAAD
jgi:uncharacterized protein (DUF2062 family)